MGDLNKEFEVNGHEIDPSAVVIGSITQTVDVAVNHMVKRLKLERGMSVSYFEVFAAVLNYLYLLGSRSMEAQDFANFETARVHLKNLVAILSDAFDKLTPTAEQLAAIEGLEKN